MSSTAYSFPAPMQKVLSRLPSYPGSVLFVAGLNMALARHLPPDTLRLLDGKKLRIQAKDAGVGFDFIWCNVRKTRILCSLVAGLSWKATQS